MGTIAESLTLRPDGDGRWLAHADPEHESITGMFGGWTAAVLLSAVRRTADGSRSPSTMAVHYIGSIKPGEDVVVTVDHLGGGRSIDHWRAEARMVDQPSVLATALVALTARRPSEPNLQLHMPDAADPSGSERIYSLGPQGKQCDLRAVSGAFGSGDSRGLIWVRDASGHPLDHPLLAYYADQYAPRSFFWGDGPGPSATISMSVYFHATDDEIDAVGDDYVLNEATGTRGEHSTSGQQANLWSRDGTLLITTEQLCWYR